MFLMPKQIGALTKLCERGEARRFALNGVQIVESDQSVRYAASDGRILGMMTVAKSDDEFPSVPGFDAGSNGAHTAIVPIDAIGAAIKSLPKKPKKLGFNCALTNVAITMHVPEGSPNPEQPEITMATTDCENPTVRKCISIDGRFPRIEDVFPTEDPALVLHFDPELLAKILGAADSLRTDDDAGVTIEVYSETKPIRIRKSNHAGIEFDGLAMPLAADKTHMMKRIRGLKRLLLESVNQELKSVPPAHELKTDDEKDSRDAYVRELLHIQWAMGANPLQSPAVHKLGCNCEYCKQD